MNPSSIPQRFYSLDVLRGGAALCVVLWHWQHFFAPLNPHGVPLELARQPFFPYLSFFYRHGFTAVELFFCLSGFVFFWLYGDPVGQRKITFGRFSVLRLSRLYPLHLATLLFVAAGQVMYRWTSERDFVYQGNDTYHFVLNLLFMSSWGFEKDYSFNAPIWSVSVEIFLYLAFFMICRYLRPGLSAIALGITGGYILLGSVKGLGLGLVFFFLGGLTFRIYDTIVRRGAWSVGRVVPLLTVLCWVGAIWITTLQPASRLAPDLRRFGDDSFAITIYLLFPLTLLSLALLETWRGRLGKRLAFIGDLTYSSYLLHFPLQLVFATVVAAFSVSPEIFYSRALFLLFFAVLCVGSYVSYHKFEVPLQRWLRMRYAGGRLRRYVH
jgi:peptidoglycan/LPS O-acetylase OafA/YrhL